VEPLLVAFSCGVGDVVFNHKAIAVAPPSARKKTTERKELVIK
jgi:hypothetical protein